MIRSLYRVKGCYAVVRNVWRKKRKPSGLLQASYIDYDTDRDIDKAADQEVEEMNGRETSLKRTKMSKSRLVLDDTTIYEIDLECERRHRGR